MKLTASDSNSHLLRWLAATFVVAVVVAVCVYVNGVAQNIETSARQISTLQSPSAETCAECHPKQVATFQNAPHMRTLLRGNDPRVVALLDDKIYRTAGNTTFQFKETNGELWLSSTNYRQPLRVDWLFGSGQHARTPVSVGTNVDGETELLQLNVSWYPQTGLGPTLGIELDRMDETGIVGVAAAHGSGQTEQCFACHVSALPMSNGAIDFHNLVPAVSCSRCHRNTDMHLKTQGDVSLTLSEWARLSPLESVNRCGECHRRADELTPEELAPQNQQLIRFASVGLTQSACFIGQQRLWEKGDGRSHRLDCLTCHDPHRPAETNHDYYNSRCLNCHAKRHELAKSCSAQRSSSDCINCHLIKVEVHDGLRFSDHWIRVQKSGD